MHELKQIWETFRQPEYIHVLLNPLPVYGLAMALLALVVGLIARSPAARATGLLLVVVAGGSVWPVAEYGERGYDRVFSMSNPDAQQWLQVHAQRASRVAVVFYVTAGLAAAALAANWKIPKVGMVLTLLTVLAVLVSLAAGGWVSHAGGQVRHREFRTGPPPHPVAFTPDKD